MSNERQPIVYTINQVVAANLRLARVQNHWTQAQTCERLAPYLGEKWSVATYSAAERSAQRTDRIRQFSANDLIAFAAAFDVPVHYFFDPDFPLLLAQRNDQESPIHFVTGRRDRAQELDADQYRRLALGTAIDLLMGLPEATAGSGPQTRTESPQFLDRASRVFADPRLRPPRSELEELRTNLRKVTSFLERLDRLATDAEQSWDELDETM